ncbi:MAG: putative porin [Sulfuricaulis sp.]
MPQQHVLDDGEPQAGTARGARTHGVAQNAWFTLISLSAAEISGMPLGFDVLQLDFNARF